MVKHTQTTCRQQPTNCLSVFGHVVGLALKGLRYLDEFISWRKFKWQDIDSKTRKVFAIYRGLHPNSGIARLRMNVYYMGSS